MLALPWLLQPAEPLNLAAGEDAVILLLELLDCVFWVVEVHRTDSYIIYYHPEAMSRSYVV